MRLRKWALDPRVEILLSLLTPFAAYWPPAYLGGSGVLAACVCGLYVSWNGPLLIPASTRLQGIFFWDLFIYLLEGALFLLTGLEARPLLERIVQVSGGELAVAALVTIVAVIAARFLWIFPAIYLPRLLVPSLRRSDPYPIWQRPFILSFTGVRGIVSLAAALALPLMTASGAPFPHRDLILLLTFWVILVTLVGQGLLLPAVINWLGLPRIAEAEQVEEHKAEVAARRAAIDAVMQRLDQLAQERSLPEALVNDIRARHIKRLKHATLADGEEGEIADRPVRRDRGVAYRYRAQAYFRPAGTRRVDRRSPPSYRTRARPSRGRTVAQYSGRFASRRMIERHALVLLGLDEISDDRRFAQGPACLEPVQPVDQDKAIAIAPNQNWGLLPDFQHTLRDLLHGLRFEQCPALHRHIDVRNLEFFPLHHGPDPPSISLGNQPCSPVPCMHRPFCVSAVSNTFNQTESFLPPWLPLCNRPFEHGCYREGRRNEIVPGDEPCDLNTLTSEAQSPGSSSTPHFLWRR